MKKKMRKREHVFFPFQTCSFPNVSKRWNACTNTNITFYECMYVCGSNNVNTGEADYHNIIIIIVVIIHVSLSFFHFLGFCLFACRLCCFFYCHISMVVKELVGEHVDLQVSIPYHCGFFNRFSYV